MAVDGLAYYFPEAMREGMGNWIDNLHKLSPNFELTPHKGVCVCGLVMGLLHRVRYYY